MDAFSKQVDQVLAHLYDYPYLQRHPLAEALAPEGSPPQQYGSHLRRLLLETMNRLDPDPDVPARSPLKREYAVLTLRYVEQLTAKEVARDLGVSERQVYRYLKQALNNLAGLLYERQHNGRAGGASRRELVYQEVRRLPDSAEPTDVVALARQACQAVGPLASERGVRLADELPLKAEPVATQPLILRQAILTALSHAVQMAVPGSTVRLGLERTADQANLCISYASERAEPGHEALSVVDALMQQINGRCTVRAGGDTMQLYCTLADRPQHTLLVIDDNEGLVDLFRRYLAQDPYRVIGATSGEEGLRLALQAPPDAIVLDVMMPEQDGWAILQRLRAEPTTHRVPVVICSVIDDPRLASSLGADVFVAKPVTEPQLREALRGCLAQARGHSPAALESA